ncbi:MAG TPA: enhanced serine sensitivity protein SseB C-terminal domain-containing protein [Candidatus Dormibacteraeota bacterium]|nr:enhanced serine sensitivity protein SseB C-terminal domain-containing protein [Candidatus Dormibacteraeota bacterium]
MEPNAIHNEPLERAMDEVARNDTPWTRQSLYRTILASTLIVAGSVSGPGNTQVAFNTLEHPPGHVVLPAFTDREALIYFAGSEIPWVAIGAQALFQSIAPGNIAEVRINPFGPGQALVKPGGVITRTEFSALAQDLMPQSMVAGNVAELQVAAGQQVTVDKCSEEPPAELLAKLADHFRQIPELHGAYLFELANGVQKSSVVGLQFDSAPDSRSMDRVMRGVGDLLRGQLPAKRSLDFMPLNIKPLLDAVRKCAKVVFERQ